MEIYREVCVALERLYERSADANNSTAQPDALHTQAPGDGNYQVTIISFFLSIDITKRRYFHNALSPRVLLSFIVVVLELIFCII